MGLHYFLASSISKPPISPSERWRLAFPDGKWSNWASIKSKSKSGDVIWLPVLHADWMSKLSQLLKAEPGRRVVVLSPLPYDAEGLRAINLGAQGYCHLHAVPELLRDVGQAAESGALWIGPELVERIVAATRDLLGRAGPAATETLPEPDLSALSPREVEVARAVSEGKTNKEVAIVLDISERTVKAHLGAVFEKLGVRDRVQLVLHLSAGNHALHLAGQPHN